MLTRNYCKAAWHHVSDNEDYRAGQLYQTSFMSALITGLDDGDDVGGDSETIAPSALWPDNASPLASLWVVLPEQLGLIRVRSYGICRNAVRGEFNSHSTTDQNFRVRSSHLHSSTGMGARASPSSGACLKDYVW